MPSWAGCLRPWAHPPRNLRPRRTHRGRRLAGGRYPRECAARVQGPCRPRADRRRGRPRRTAPPGGARRHVRPPGDPPAAGTAAPIPRSTGASPMDACAATSGSIPISGPGTSWRPPWSIPCSRARSSRGRGILSPGAGSYDRRASTARSTTGACSASSTRRVRGGRTGDRRSRQSRRSPRRVERRRSRSCGHARPRPDAGRPSVSGSRPARAGLRPRRALARTQLACRAWASAAYGHGHAGPMDGPDREEAGPQRSPASVCLEIWSGREDSNLRYRPLCPDDVVTAGPARGAATGGRRRPVRPLTRTPSWWSADA